MDLAYSQTLTVLDAVNIMLTTINEAPIDSLAEDYADDVGAALEILKETTRDVQLDPWHFNVEHGVTLNVNSDNEIQLPNDVINVEYPFATIRGNRLYNLREHSYKFDNLPQRFIRAKVTKSFIFEELPEQVKLYVARKAATLLAQRAFGADGVVESAREREAEARIKARSADIRWFKANAMYTPPRPGRPGGYTPYSVVRRRY